MKKIKSFLNGFKHGFSNFGMIITNIVNTLLLLAIYFIGVGMAAVIVKITRQKLMTLEKNKIGSYYNNKKTEKQDIEEYYKQY